MRWIFLIVIAFCHHIHAQTTIYVYDSSTQVPIAGVSLIIFKYPTIYYSDLDGKISIQQSLVSNDSIVLSSLGYERRIFSALHLPARIYLTQRHYALPDVTVKPTLPKDYIKRAFDSFYINHLPKPFSQNVFYREEFIVNDRYARFQEMDIEVYQFPKTSDKRKYYISGSYPKVHKFFKRDDSMLMQDIRNSLGKIVGKNLNFNHLTGYSYAKGVNMLNFVFTHLLENKDIEFKYIGMENIKGHQAIHLRGHYFKDKINYNNIEIYLEENTYAILHIAIQANDENLTKQFLDFKTRAILWLLGIKIDIKKYYSKIQFTKTKQGFWVVDDFMLMFPITIKKKKKLDMYMNIGYRMSPNLNFQPKSLNYSVYEENQHLFDTQKTNERFSESIPYGIPILPAQIERLKRMNTPLSK